MQTMQKNIYMKYSLFEEPYDCLATVSIIIKQVLGALSGLRELKALWQMKTLFVLKILKF